MQRLVTLGAVFGTALLPGAADAHVPGTGGPGGELLVAPGLAIVALLAGLWCMAGYVRLRRRSERPLASPADAVALLLGVAVVLVALCAPLDALADASLSAHMAQHMLLMLVAPALIAAGRAEALAFWALPLAGRRALGRAWTVSGAPVVARRLRRPLAAGVLFNAAFLFWHMPAVFHAALASETLHILEHLSFFAGGLLFWSVALDAFRAPAAPAGPRLLMVLATLFIGGLPSAVLSLSNRPIFFVEGSGPFGLSALQDQQVAGLLMWLGMDGVFLVLAAALFAVWLRGFEKRPPLRFAVPHALPAILLPLLLAGLGGCNPPGRAAQASAGTDRVARAPHLMAAYGCGTCHRIPGVDGADGVVGPPLDQMGRRVYIAGYLRNSPENMVRWIMQPQAVLPGNAMPDMDVGRADAESIAAYLQGLR